MAFTTKQGRHWKLGVTVFSCDYNGWTDVPEEEREAVDAFEAAPQLPAAPPVHLVTRPHLYLPRFPLTKAA